jgi:hypothetical protein
MIPNAIPDNIDPTFRDFRYPKETLLCTFSTSARWFSRITGFFLIRASQNAPR